jgi:hypothetical protein
MGGADNQDLFIIELLLLPRTFTRDELLKLAKTKEVKVMLGGYQDFELTEKQLGILCNVAARMVP